MNRFPSANSDTHGRTRGVGGCGRRPRVVCAADPSGPTRARAAVPDRCRSGILKGMESLFADEAFARRPRIVAPGAVWLPAFLSDRAQSWIVARRAGWQSGPVPGREAGV